MSEHHRILDRVYALRSPEECETTYDAWAATYEHDTTEEMGYAAPAHTAEHLAGLLVDRPDAEILDAGCGTGLVGAALSERGPWTIDGLDLSAAMLDHARAKGVYRDLAKADLTRRLPLEDDSYDAVICVGTLTEGHVGPEAFDELIRVARPGAPIVVTVLDRIWEPSGYKAKVTSLRESGAVHLEESIPRSVYHRKEDITCHLVVLRAR
ncbi:class I SAM-dependent methyltransferase [Nocardiopsis sp. MG754419]|uniref:class I SAM-dependent DNA methyltransferase n=1 Tax=Nocardiopsis sp. MG754419 TaxID=2259865 RepID=UPI001BA45921|nr:class I SAM-dependent methyltransferase [Nocardiopsis sp. MG754419]MBR8744976.1 SAM-dependent methyltransferase [Nocardiopsis sp. MG754419]